MSRPRQSEIPKHQERSPDLTGEPEGTAQSSTWKGPEAVADCIKLHEGIDRIEVEEEEEGAAAAAAAVDGVEAELEEATGGKAGMAATAADQELETIQVRR